MDQAAGPIATTHDAFLGGAVMLRQPRRGYRAGIDPVLLAAACPAQTGEHVLDCGAGIGTVGLCLARRVDGACVTLVEQSPTLAALARDNVRDNDLSARVDVVEADLTQPLNRSPALSARTATFDHVLANPPFFEHASGTRSPDAIKDGANAMAADQLDHWARFMAAMTRPGGQVTIIHRAEALMDLLAVLAPRFGGLSLLPIHPRASEPANRIILRGIKGSRAGLTIRPPLVLHAETGNGYRQEIDAVLRTPCPLPL